MKMKPARKDLATQENLKIFCSEEFYEFSVSRKNNILLSVNPTKRFSTKH